VARLQHTFIPGSTVTGGSNNGFANDWLTLL
jgi:hypothetical protein